jgi:hypothetical protein
MHPPRRTRSFSEVLRALPADVRRFTQALRRSPPPLYVPDVELKIFEACCDHYKLIDGRVCTERPNYETPFPQETTRCIWCIIIGHWVEWQLTREYTLAFNIYRPDGTLLSHQTEDKVEIPLKYCDLSDFTWRTFGYGWREPGHWPTGEYQAEVIIDGVRVATGHFTIAPPPPPPPPKPPAENLQLASVRFYAGRGASHKEARMDSVRFPQQTTREVICELTVRNLLYGQRNYAYHMTAQCYTPEGKLLWESHHNWLIKAAEEEPSISWGWQAPGQWEAGAYCVEILIDGVNFAWGAFLIE